MCAPLAELSNLSVNVGAVQETHFTYRADCRVLDNYFVVYSAFGSNLSARVSLLVGRSLDAIVNFVFAGDRGRLLVADVTVKTFEFRIAAVYVPDIAVERCLFFWRLGSFVDASKRTVMRSIIKIGPVGVLVGRQGVTAACSIFLLSSI